MSSENVNTDSNEVHRPPPIKIGAGLSRSKLVNRGTSLKSVIKLSSALTSPTRVNISSSGLTPVSRTNSERYLSAYGRLGALRNTSSPALNDQESLNDKKGAGSRVVGPSKDYERSYGSAKRASYPAFTFPVRGVSVDQGSKGQTSTESSRPSGFPVSKNLDVPDGKGHLLAPDGKGHLLASDGKGHSLPQERKGVLLEGTKDYSTPSTEKLVVTKSRLDAVGKPESYENRELKDDTQLKTNVSQGIRENVKVDESKRTVNAISKPTTDEVIQSKRLVNTMIKPTYNEDAANFNRNSIKSDDQQQIFVVPPRRRHRNKAKESNVSPEELNNNTEQLKPETGKIFVGKSSHYLGTMNNITETINSTNETGVAIATSAEVEETPQPMQRTRRRLTKRNLSFKRLEDDEYIGFASLPEQVHRKAVRRGFEFTLMVVGETGLGKSTLINSLFLTDLYKDRKMGKIEERVQKTVELEKKELEIEEKGVKLKLTIVDTPGFSDAVNAEESWKPIVNYIDKQFESYFKAESGLNRKNIQDTRVHCCLYFISPYGHGLRPVDVLVMKKLHHKVNIVPLVAKSDMLTKKEIKALKEKVLLEIEKHRIQIYQFPDCDSDEDEDFKQQDQELKKAIPFAVVGSNTVVEAGGKKIRGRMYPWGIVEVENPSHCDFVKLRQMLISTHMQDLKDVTCDSHYENYRAEHISEQMSGHQKERGKLKRDSVTNMDKVIDTERLLQEKEAEIKRMQEMLAKMQTQLNQNSPKLNGRVAAV